MPGRETAQGIFPDPLPDLAGPLRKRSRGGAKYLLTVVDDYTRKTWAIPIMLKSHVRKTLTDWAMRETTQAKALMQVLRTDRGREFVNAQMIEWCAQRGIAHEKTFQHNPQQNGVAERHNQLLFNNIRTQLFWSGLPVSFWAEAAIAAADILNHWPRSALDGGTPTGKWTGDA